MKTRQEILEEIGKLHTIKNLDESGLFTRIITMIALEWTLGEIPIAPSERLKEVLDEMPDELLEGVVSDEPGE